MTTVDRLASRNRKFESISLQRGVRCELDPTGGFNEAAATSPRKPGEPFQTAAVA
jgi:hypothetical protein